jgi:hypothetical protein
VKAGSVAEAAEDSVHARLQLGALGRPLNFTVRRRKAVLYAPRKARRRTL